ncbi:MAG: Trk system potassium transporter TrkA [Candidatus Nanohaloarchaea archaeon]|nr:Trk system potassium transporter TrkA [Candidatus Nanohaloarchaea archaeon]
MRIVIAGAGQVGTKVASELSEDHEIVLIDQDTDRTDRLQYELDVLTVTGDCSAIETLRDADIGDADIFIASTDDDEINMIACGTAKALGDVTTVARVQNVKYINTWSETEDILGVDYMVGTNLLAVAGAVGGSRLSAARDFDIFAGGRVQMAEFEVGKSTPVAGKTVSAADTFDSLTFAAILRSGKTIIPTGSTTIQAGDNIVIIGEPEAVHNLGIELSNEAGEARNVLIVGGSEIGCHTARLLEEIGFSPHIIATDYDRSRELSERLSTSKIRHKNTTYRDFMESERMEDVDVVVTAIEKNSEANLLAALRSKRNGAGRSVAVVNHAEHVELFEDAGVDVAVNPQRATAQDIINFVRNQDTQHAALLEEGQAKVMDVHVDADSALTGRPISEVAAELPDSLVIGAVTRKGSFLAPRGDTVIKPGDRAVVFADSEVADDVSEIL